MRKTTIQALSALTLGLALAATSFASDMKMEKKGAIKNSMDLSELGTEIHTSTVDGYEFKYRLIETAELQKAMEAMTGKTTKGHSMGKATSHHLMAFIFAPDGSKITDGKVGYKVEGPDNSEQKTMAMGMLGGFGADVDFKATGTYEIKTKIKADDVKLVDGFKYALN